MEAANLAPTNKLEQFSDETKLLKLIRLYRANECLWNQNSTGYHNLALKENAWNRMVRLFGDEFNVDQLKSQVSMLRQYYDAEYKLFQQSKKTGETFEPQHSYYYKLEFLRNNENEPPETKIVPSETRSVNTVKGTINCVTKDTVLGSVETMSKNASKTININSNEAEQSDNIKQNILVNAFVNVIEKFNHSANKSESPLKLEERKCALYKLAIDTTNTSKSKQLQPSTSSCNKKSLTSITRTASGNNNPYPTEYCIGGGSQRPSNEFTSFSSPTASLQRQHNPRSRQNMQNNHHKQQNDWPGPKVCNQPRSKSPTNQKSAKGQNLNTRRSSNGAVGRGGVGRESEYGCGCNGSNRKNVGNCENYSQSQTHLNSSSFDEDDICAVCSKYSNNSNNQQRQHQHQEQRPKSSKMCEPCSHDQYENDNICPKKEKNCPCKIKKQNEEMCEYVQDAHSNDDMDNRPRNCPSKRLSFQRSNEYIQCDRSEYSNRIQSGGFTERFTHNGTGHRDQNRKVKDIKNKSGCKYQDDCPYCEDDLSQVQNQSKPKQQIIPKPPKCSSFCNGPVGLMKQLQRHGRHYFAQTDTNEVSKEVAEPVQATKANEEDTQSQQLEQLKKNCECPSQSELKKPKKRAKPTPCYDDTCDVSVGKRKNDRPLKNEEEDECDDSYCSARPHRKKEAEPETDDMLGSEAMNNEDTDCNESICPTWNRPENNNDDQISVCFNPQDNYRSRQQQRQPSSKKPRAEKCDCGYKEPYSKPPCGDRDDESIADNGYGKKPCDSNCKKFKSWRKRVDPKPNDMMPSATCTANNCNAYYRSPSPQNMEPRPMRKCYRGNAPGRAEPVWEECTYFKDDDSNDRNNKPKSKNCRCTVPPNIKGKIDNFQRSYKTSSDTDMHPKEDDMDDQKHPGRCQCRKPDGDALTQNSRRANQKSKQVDIDDGMERPQDRSRANQRSRPNKYNNPSDIEEEEPLPKGRRNNQRSKQADFEDDERPEKCGCRRPNNNDDNPSPCSRRDNKKPKVNDMDDDRQYDPRSGGKPKTKKCACCVCNENDNDDLDNQSEMEDGDEASLAGYGYGKKQSSCRCGKEADQKPKKRADVPKDNKKCGCPVKNVERPPNRRPNECVCHDSKVKQCLCALPCACHAGERRLEISGSKCEVGVETDIDMTLRNRFNPNEDDMTEMCICLVSDGDEEDYEDDDTVCSCDGSSQPKNMQKRMPCPATNRRPKQMEVGYASTNDGFTRDGRCSEDYCTNPNLRQRRAPRPPPTQQMNCVCPSQVVPEEKVVDNPESKLNCECPYPDTKTPAEYSEVAPTDSKQQSEVNNNPSPSKQRSGRRICPRQSKKYSSKMMRAKTDVYAKQDKVANDFLYSTRNKATKLFTSKRPAQNFITNFSNWRTNIDAEKSPDVNGCSSFEMPNRKFKQHHSEILRERTSPQMKSNAQIKSSILRPTSPGPYDIAEVKENSNEMIIVYKKLGNKPKQFHKCFCPMKRKRASSGLDNGPRALSQNANDNAENSHVGVSELLNEACGITSAVIDDDQDQEEGIELQECSPMYPCDRATAQKEKESKLRKAGIKPYKAKPWMSQKQNNSGSPKEDQLMRKTRPWFARNPFRNLNMNASKRNVIVLYPPSKDFTASKNSINLTSSEAQLHKKS